MVIIRLLLWVNMTKSIIPNCIKREKENQQDARIPRIVKHSSPYPFHKLTIPPNLLGKCVHITECFAIFHRIFDFPRVDLMSLVSALFLRSVTDKNKTVKCMNEDEKLCQSSNANVDYDAHILAQMHILLLRAVFNGQRYDSIGLFSEKIKDLHSKKGTKTSRFWLLKTAMNEEHNVSDDIYGQIGVYDDTINLQLNPTLRQGMEVKSSYDKGRYKSKYKMNHAEDSSIVEEHHRTQQSGSSATSLKNSDKCDANTGIVSSSSKPAVGTDTNFSLGVTYKILEAKTEKVEQGQIEWTKVRGIRMKFSSHDTILDLTWKKTNHRFALSLRAFFEARGLDFPKAPVLNKSPIDMYALYSWVVSHGGFKTLLKKSMWKEVRPYIDNYAEDNVQAPYIIRRNYEKYLKDYEEFYNGGFGPTMPGEYISEKLYGAPIGKVLQNAVVSVSSKTQTFQYESAMIDDQKIKREVNNLIEGIDWKKICFEIRQGESRNRSLVAHRKNIFFNRLDLDHPLRYLSPFGTFASTYINKSEDLSPLVFINEVHQQWASLSSKEKKYYHSISSQKRQEYISNKLVYDKCLNLFQEKYISFFEVCENQNVSIKKRKLEFNFK